MIEKIVQKVIDVKHYIAEDGKEFDDYNKCKEHDDSIYYDRCKSLFEFKWIDNYEEEEFRVTYKANYHEEFLKFISKLILEELRADDTMEENDFRVENIENVFKEEAAPLVDGHVYNIDTLYSYENDDWDHFSVFIEDVSDTHVVTDIINNELIKNKDFQKILEDFKRKHQHINSEKVISAIRMYYDSLQFLK